MIVVFCQFLNAVKEETSSQTHDDTLKDEEFSYLVNNFKKFVRNNRRLPDKFKGDSSKNRNDKRAKRDTKNA